MQEQIQKMKEALRFILSEPTLGAQRPHLSELSNQIDALEKTAELNPRRISIATWNHRVNLCLASIKKIREGLSEDAESTEATTLAGLLEAMLCTHPAYGVQEMARDSFVNSEAHGFYEGQTITNDTIAMKLALIHAEISEALEEIRKNKAPTEIYTEGHKPEGFPVELADAVIRIGDLCGWLGIDLEAAIIRKMAYNKSRPHKHGKQF